MAEFDPVALLRALCEHDVRFVVVGSIAAIAQGYPLPTVDIDITPSDDAENHERLGAAIRALGCTVPTDARTEDSTIATQFGELNILLRPAGTRGYGDLVRDAFDAELADGLVVPIASLRDVIRMKEASNRLKDQAQLPALRQTLEVIRERERKSR